MVPKPQRPDLAGIDQGVGFILTNGQGVGDVLHVQDKRQVAKVCIFHRFYLLIKMMFVHPAGKNGCPGNLVGSWSHTA